MSAKIPVELATGIVGNWKETYRWIPIFGAVAVFAVAFSAGANNIPTAFSTPIGSGAISFLKVSIVACAIYVPGAGFARRSGVNALFSDTSLLRHENAEKRILVFLPIFYGLAAGLLCLFIMFQVLPIIVSVYKWVMIVAIVSATLIGALLSLIVVVPFARQRFDTRRNLGNIKGSNSISQIQLCLEKQDQRSDDKLDHDEEGQEHFEEALKDFMQMRCLDTVYEEEDERSWTSPEAANNKEISGQVDQLVSLESNNVQSAPFKNLLQSTPNRLIQTRNFQKIEEMTAMENASKFIWSLAKSTFFPIIKYEKRTLIRHALAEKFDEMEDFFGFPLLLASCIFALVQSASEIATLVSPFEAILDVFKHRSKYSGNGEDVGYLRVDWWFRAMRGLSAATGFFLCGWRLTQCLGTKVTYISNSRGMASQLSAVATIIVVTRMKLPVSTVHAFVGSLVGVGIADDPQNVNWKLLAKFIGGWIFTIVFCCTVSYCIYSFSIHSPAYVVP